jgi:Ser/Thr protein kinase RdoA (MazF antagonist)
MVMQTSTAVLPIEPKRLQEIGGFLEKACAAMQTANVPDTLIHNDMNGDNILFDGTQAVFTDWAEAAIGNPFFTFHHLRALAIREDHTRTWAHQLTAAYKRHWYGLLSESDLDRALALSRPLAIVSYLYGRDPSFESEYRHAAHSESYARSLARHLDRAIQAPEFMGALCD